MEVETAVTPGHVSNAQFMRDVMGPLAAGEYAWACHFAAPPNSALAEWGGFRVSEYAQVEDYKVNAYCSVAIVSDRRQGRHFIRMTCVVLDDSQPDPHASWVLETSPGNYQVGYIIWPAITDEGVASRLQKALSEQGLVKADQSGYSSVRYVRLPVGCNTKVSPPYPHRLLDWQPECIFTLDDLIEKFDLDADEILNPQTRIAPAQGAPSAPFADRRFTSEDSEYVRSIVMGDMYHDSLLALSARYVARGMPPAQVTEALRGMMQAREVRDDRWQARLEEIPRLVRGAAEKFTPQPAAEAEGEDADHPLSIEVKLSGQLIPPRMVIPGFVAEGIVSFAGQHGIGKTTGILPLSFIAAGLIKGELTPAHWRHVVYVTEDTAQAQRIISGLAQSIGLDYGTIAQRFHLVEAVRMHASQVVQVAQTYAERYTRLADHGLGDTKVELKPLVVFDTKSAVFSMENENDAAEAAEMMSTLKQRFNRFPVWIIGHIAKASFGKTDALSARGSTAIEADAHQNAYIVAEGDRRYIILGKRRFEAKWAEIELVSEVSESFALDEFGQAQTIAIRWAIPRPPSMTRQEAAQAAREESQGESDTQRRTAILKAVEDAWMAGNPISRVKLRDLVSGKVATINTVTETLIVEGWLYEVEVPPARRVNNNKKAFLVRLTDSERRGYLEAGALPEQKTRLFPAWATGAIPSVPDTVKDPSKSDDFGGDDDW
jgi:hypothetical protein